MLLGSGCLDLGDDDCANSSSPPHVSHVVDVDVVFFSLNHLSLSQTQPQPTTLFS